MMATLADWLPDIGLGDAFFTLLIAFFGAETVMHDQDLLRQLRHNGPARTCSLVVFCGDLFLNGVLSPAVASNVRRDHWLWRALPTRYTVATVTRSYYSRSDRKFVFTYQVGAYQGQSQGECNDRCPAISTRRHLRFAAEAPHVCELTPHYPDDTVRTLPPLGWAHLPQ